MGKAIAVNYYTVNYLNLTKFKFKIKSSKTSNQIQIKSKTI